MIKPTVGRVVWYRESAAYYPPTQAMAAIVTKVTSDNLVNLAVFGPLGDCQGRLNVVLVQDTETPPKIGAYCEWMPYQKAVAAGTIPPTLHA